LIQHRGVKVLLDIEDASRGRTNHLDQYPQVAERLEAKYEQWRREQHAIRVEIEPIGSSGAAIVRGDGVQRAPGQSGFTFAIGVTPDSDVAAGDTTQVVANHPPYWRLSYEPGHALSLTMLGEELQGPVLEEGRCTALIVTSFYHFSRRYPQNNRAMINLYVDGVMVDSVAKKNPAAVPSEFGRPTFIGFDSDSGPLSRLHLSTPHFYNEWFAPAAVSTTRSNTIEELNDSLCSPVGGDPHS